MSNTRVSVIAGGNVPGEQEYEYAVFRRYKLTTIAYRALPDGEWQDLPGCPDVSQLVLMVEMISLSLLTNADAVAKAIHEIGG